MIARGWLAVEPFAFEQERFNTQAPACANVTERGEVGDVTSVQPARLAELPLREALPVQAVAPVTDQLTWIAVPTVAVAGAVNTKFGGCGASGGPLAVRPSCAKPVAFVQVMLKL